MLRKLAVVTAIAAGALALTAGPAQAAHRGCDNFSQQSGPNYGILNGLQIGAPIDLGLDVSHNALGLLGLAYAAGGDDNDTVTCTYGGGY